MNDNINENFRWLSMGLPEDILRRKLCGDLEGAVRLIDRRLADKKTPEALRRCLTAEREMILRLPGDYPYTKEEALRKARERIPDFTEEEFDERVDAGTIRWIYQNGEPRYFDRFFETLCKTEAGFADRAGVVMRGAESAGGDSPETRRLKACIRQMKEEGAVRRRIRVRASLRVKDEYFVPGMKVRAHLPIPADCAGQTDILLEEMTPGAAVAPGDALQRTVCWEEELMENHAFVIQYSYLRTAGYQSLEAAGTAESAARTDFPGRGESLTPSEQSSLTREEAPHILFTPYIRELALELSKGADSPLEKARRFYDYITLHMTYTYMPSYFSLENIAENCARSFTGDCGVFALLFLTLCRFVKIPACWQSGLITEPDFCGAHDWVRFYIDPLGWLYADPSYGLAAVRAGDEERRRFYFGNIDPFRMTANQAFQAPFTVEKRHWRADPYDNQVGELETAERGLRYEEFERSKEVLLCREE